MLHHPSHIAKASGSSTPHAGHCVNKALALFLLFFASPLFLFNTFLAKCKGEQVFLDKIKTDALGRSVSLRYFRCGFGKRCALLLDIFSGRLSFCGVPLTHSLPLRTQQKFLNLYNIPTGFFSLYDLHRLVGLSATDKALLLQQQIRISVLGYVTLLTKCVFCYFFYNTKKTISSPHVIPIFGIGINNTTMHQAVAWTLNGQKFEGIETQRTYINRPRTAFYINANSINMMARHDDLVPNLKMADCLFADGSGIRIAAKACHMRLRDNLNGTDMLPALCKEACKQGKSIYLLGSKPGVAKSASEKLMQQYPGLRIVGCQHGYFSAKENVQVIADINQVKPDVVLLGQGTPLQERWIIEHRDTIQCRAILGVGGLFDYFSGNIPRAPLWMRELGMEWIWRLMQEPVTKFKRYVFGNPEFLYRTFILKQVSQNQE